MRPLLALLLILAGCNTPPAYFSQSTVQTLSVEGSTFDVRIRDQIALAMRTNPEPISQLKFVEARARAAMEEVSKCKVVETLGDVSVMMGALSCDGRPAPSLAALSPPSLDCYEVDRYTSGATQEEVVFYDCDVDL